MRSVKTSLVILTILAPLKAIGQEVNSIDCIRGTTYSSGPTCSWTKELDPLCKTFSTDNIFSFCNIFNLRIGQSLNLVDENEKSYSGTILKYSERNSCSTGGNDKFSILGKCDTFAAYAMPFRAESDNKCFMFVNSALLGTTLLDESIRNNPRKQVRKVEIPGVSRRITFVPSKGERFKGQSGFEFLQTSEINRRAQPVGQALSSIAILELENTLTTKEDNLKPNPAKLRITRGASTSGDYLDIELGKNEEAALNGVLRGCA